ncbi:MAG: aspartyl/asparaginyl beta-hydroxylase domain-containing protein [Flavobacteriia bacterium]|nr:aspartyl/asparaginyl beta-hydroxylase domain-containing protein [Flavobacteriia bacterium]OJX35016.1 MAG: hypothetical protein BGO87_09785 [Flavobacteriia bacterium 40-80]
MASSYFFDKENFSYVPFIESKSAIITEELTSLLKEDVQNWTSAYPNYLTSSSLWKTFEFLFFGINHIENSKRCPRTAEIIREIPQIISAQFSILHPASHILPHKGYSKLILRNHLPLIVPEGQKCAIRIENITHYWKKNELVIFDDSFTHEAWNESDEIRVVLMFDIAKPDCGYTAEEICRYKIENLNDQNLLNYADKKTWMKWFRQGFFDFNS